MGEVWRARDTRLQRDVAIKVLPAELSRDESRLKRFEKEARSASALNHPNIVTIYDIGQSDSVSYIAMELVEGKTLRELLFAGPLPIKRVLSIAAQVAEGLGRAHEAGIVHRDLKPENLMVTKDGRVKILDFGLAKLTYTGVYSGEGPNIPTETGTGAGVVLGTVGYMSPEQASGQPVDFRSDQFSLGSVLYELVTGKRAFQKKSGAETLAAIIAEEPAPIAVLKPEVPARLRWLLERCLVKDPEGRYAATKDLLRDLESLQSQLADTARAESAIRFGRRRLTAVAVGLALALAALAAFFLARRQQANAAAASSIRFRQVTFDEQAINEGRFAPDGETFVYSAFRLADPEAKPADLFMARVAAPNPVGSAFRRPESARSPRAVRWPSFWVGTPGWERSLKRRWQGALPVPCSKTCGTPTGRRTGRPSPSSARSMERTGSNFRPGESFTRARLPRSYSEARFSIVGFHRKVTGLRSSTEKRGNSRWWTIMEKSTGFSKRAPGSTSRGLLGLTRSGTRSSKERPSFTL
jgi:hypothetical protein